MIARSKKESYGGRPYADEADLEALKRWWDENGKGLVGAVAVAGLGTLGWQQYQDYSTSQVEAASDLYASMLSTQLEGGDPEQLAAVAEMLKEDHAGTAYARFGAMLQARVAVEADDLATAETALRWALSAGDTRDDFGQLIQLRLARVLAAQGKEAEGAGHFDTGQLGLSHCLLSSGWRHSPSRWSNRGSADGISCRARCIA